jgi:hypothetical protein
VQRFRQDRFGLLGRRSPVASGSQLKLMEDGVLHVCQDQFRHQSLLSQSAKTTTDFTRSTFPIPAGTRDVWVSCASESAGRRLGSGGWAGLGERKAQTQVSSE